MNVHSPHMWRSEDNLQEPVPATEILDQTQEVRFGKKLLYSHDYLTGLVQIVFDLDQCFMWLNSQFLSLNLTPPPSKQLHEPLETAKGGSSPPFTRTPKNWLTGEAEGICEIQDPRGLHFTPRQRQESNTSSEVQTAEMYGANVLFKVVNSLTYSFLMELHLILKKEESYWVKMFPASLSPNFLQPHSRGHFSLSLSFRLCLAHRCKTLLPHYRNLL